MGQTKVRVVGGQALKRRNIVLTNGRLGDRPLFGARMELAEGGGEAKSGFSGAVVGSLLAGGAGALAGGALGSRGHKVLGRITWADGDAALVECNRDAWRALLIAAETPPKRGFSLAVHMFGASLQMLLAWLFLLTMFGGCIRLMAGG